MEKQSSTPFCEIIRNLQGAARLSSGFVEPSRMGNAQIPVTRYLSRIVNHSIANYVADKSSFNNT